MNLALVEWLKIERLAEAIRDAKEALDAHLISLLEPYRDDAEVTAMLLKLLGLNDHGDLHPHMVHPQATWRGGSSQDPKNFQLREPNIVNFPRTFPPEQQEDKRIFLEREARERREAALAKWKKLGYDPRAAGEPAFFFFLGTGLPPAESARMAKTVERDHVSQV